jgi:hypothetical protein
MKAREMSLLALATCSAALVLSGAEDSRQKSSGESATVQTLKCEVLLDVLPNPLTLRVLNAQREAFRYSTFMSSHATMPPMPNVRVEVTEPTSRRIRTCTPVVLTEKRSSVVLKPGEAEDIQVYHRGFVDLPPGTYEVAVLLFNDTDSKQQAPIAVSPSITVRIKPRADEHVKGP